MPFSFRLMILLSILGTLICLIFGQGCATVQKITPEDTVCENAPVDSIICKNIKNPKSVDLLLKMSTGALIRLNVFAINDIEDFFEDVEQYIINGISYHDLYIFVSSKIKEVQDVVGPEVIMLSEYYDLFQYRMTLISEYDQELLLQHIRNQKDTITLYRLMEIA